MRTRSSSLTRKFSTTSLSSCVDLPEPRGRSRRARSLSVQSRYSVANLPIFHGGDLLQVPEEDTVFNSDLASDLPKRPLWQLVLLNVIVVGVEFCYAVETALVIPILLEMGLPESLYSLTWIVSPTLGFFLNPVIGSYSDRCYCSWGRRRPFILALCIGIVLGLTVFLNGEYFGLLAGDSANKHTIGLILTIIGVVILDCCSDSCDSPSKAYIIDVCNLKDVEKALNIRAVLGGLGSGAGYLFNSIDWESNVLGRALGSQMRVVFVFAFAICSLSFTLTLISVKEKPLVPATDDRPSETLQSGSGYQSLAGRVPKAIPRRALSYGSIFPTSTQSASVGNALLNDALLSKDSQRFSGANAALPSSQTSQGNQVCVEEAEFKEEPITVGQLLVSVVRMPRELRWLCLNHFLGWAGLLAIFLFYTDYVAEVVYKGDPTAPKGSPSRLLYEAGVKMGSWGMLIFSASVVISAVIIDKLSVYITPRTAYVWGQTVFAVGTGCMAIFSSNIYATLALNATPGVMFVTVTTLPFSIVAEYHQSYQTLQDTTRSQRGLGTDVACLSSVNTLAQIVVSAVLGLIIQAVGSKIVIVLFASALGFLAALNSAVFVIYEVTDKDVKSTEERQSLVK